MSNAPPLLVARGEGIVRLTLNRPEKLNAFSVALHRALAAALDEAAADRTTRVVLLTGAGKAFSAGQDLAERDVESDAPLDLGANIEAWYNPLVRRLIALPCPLVCAVNGVAAGAGANIALLGDIVLAKRSARFIQSFGRIGLMPDSGGTWTLPHLAGQARALGLALLAEPIDADRAEAWGMIWKALPDEDFEAAVETLVATLAQAPTRAMAAIRQAIRVSWTVTLDQQLNHERDAQRQLGLTQDYREGVRAFKARRPAQFQGK